MKKLGFGLMRLPSIEGTDETDIKQLEKMVDMFIDRGFTYFDTAWMYTNYKSEDIVKEVLTKRHSLDSYTLATKLHAAYIKTKSDRDDIFSKQLKKTGRDYFDYYLLHDMGDAHYDIYKKLDCFEWIKEKKKAGYAKHIGFSHHGSPELVDKVFTECPEMEFVQLQINYLDWESDSVKARLCYEAAKKHGKKVIVMEPVKGGALANVPYAVERAFKEYDSKASAASWAIRFAASLENVMVVLSGMSTLAQVDDNTSFMNEMKPVNDEEMKIIMRAAEIIKGEITVACTGCSYCTAGCPAGIPIPKYFSLYNAERKDKNDGESPYSAYYKELAESASPATSCVECGQCEQICPQHLSVISCLKDVADTFEH